MTNQNSNTPTIQKKLTVIRIISGLWPGGVEKKLTALLPILNRDLFNVKVVCLRKEGELAPLLRERNIPVTLVPIRSRWSPTGLRNLSRFLKKEKADIVHTHMYRSNISGTVAARLAGVPVVVGNIHNIDSWDNLRQIRMDRLISRWRHCTVFVSEGVKRDYLREVNLPDFRYEVIYNGVDTLHYCPGPVTGENHPGGTLNVGLAARLMPQKGLELLVKAAAEPDFQSMGVHFTIAGDGPLKAQLLEMARDTGAEKHFHIQGFVEHIREFYRFLDIFAMPSLKEGFSNALIEAMACGVPPVATAVGGNAEAIQSGHSGLLVPSGDYPAFAGALRTLLTNSQMRQRMALAAVERASCFSLDRMARQTEQLYLNLWSRQSQ